MWELILLGEGINIPNSPGRAHLKKGIKPNFNSKVRIINLTLSNMLETCVFAKRFEWRKYLFWIFCKIIGQIKTFQFPVTVINHYWKSTFSWSMFYYIYILTWTKILMAVSSCHVTFAFQGEPTIYSCLNVKELLA